MRDPAGDWERRRRQRRRLHLVLGVFISAALSISAVVAVLAYLAAKLRESG
jgi:hypothetical protein